MRRGFSNWSALLDYIAMGRGRLYYQAPLDYIPIQVEVVRVFKNRKVRLRRVGNTFTADFTHLNRFSYLGQVTSIIASGES